MILCLGLLIIFYFGLLHFVNLILDALYLELYGLLALRQRLLIIVTFTIIRRQLVVFILLLFVVLLIVLLL